MGRLTLCLSLFENLVTHSYQGVQYFHLSKQKVWLPVFGMCRVRLYYWYGCQCLACVECACTLWVRLSVFGMCRVCLYSIMAFIWRKHHGSLGRWVLTASRQPGEHSALWWAVRGAVPVTQRSPPGAWWEWWLPEHRSGMTAEVWWLPPSAGPLSASSQERDL